jgi:hypothetical protein
LGQARRVSALPSPAGPGSPLPPPPSPRGGKRWRFAAIASATVIAMVAAVAVLTDAERQAGQVTPHPTSGASSAFSPPGASLESSPPQLATVQPRVFQMGGSPCRQQMDRSPSVGRVPGRSPQERTRHGRSICMSGPARRAFCISTGRGRSRVRSSTRRVDCCRGSRRWIRMTDRPRCSSVRPSGGERDSTTKAVSTRLVRSKWCMQMTGSTRWDAASPSPTRNELIAS